MSGRRRQSGASIWCALVALRTQVTKAMFLLHTITPIFPAFPPHHGTAGRRQQLGGGAQHQSIPLPALRHAPDAMHLVQLQVLQPEIVGIVQDQRCQVAVRC